MNKPRSKAIINATLAQKADRSVTRIGRLKLAIAKAKSHGNIKRTNSLQAELDRRTGELKEFTRSVSEVVGE